MNQISLSLFQETQRERVNDGQLTSIAAGWNQASPLLILVWSQLGDFDTLEYAWWLQKRADLLQAQNITLRAVAIGDRNSGLKFCDYTGFPPEALFVDPEAELHQKLELYPGLRVELPFLSSGQKAWLNLMLMCAGIGSQGTLKEVLRGYRGDKTAPQLIEAEETIEAKSLPPLKGSFFNWAGGAGFQRPFELATLRLRNMTEVLTNWKTYVPDSAYLTQRGGTFLFNAQGDLTYQHQDKGILGFAETMNNPLSFLETDKILQS